MATLLLGTTVGGHAVIHAGNIASQSVNYANSAGSVAWTNVSGRPTALSQFTNDLGNYGNWITASALSGYATISYLQSYAAPRAYVTDSFVDFYIYGDQNKYYPVTIHNWNGGNGFQRYSIHRGYSWTAPWDPINTGSHQGGLTFTFEWSGDIAWGGNDKTIRVTQFSETYTQMIAGMQLAHCEGVVVWIRGGGSGGAHYRLHGPGGLSQSFSINMSAWTSCAGITYDVRSYDGNLVDTEIYNRYPVRNNTGLFVNNNAVATESWVISQAYLTSIPSHNHDSLYVPLGRTITINGVTQDLSANRSFTVSSSLPAHNHDDRYYTEGESDGRFTRNLGFQAFVGSLNDLDGQYTVNLDGYGPINGYGGPDTAYNASLWGIGNRNRGAQIYIPYAYDQLYFRRGASDWSSWFRVLNTSADPYPSNMNQYLRTTDSPTFSSTISVTADGSAGYVASRIWLYSHNNYRGAGVYMSGTGSTWFAGTGYTDFDGTYIISRRSVAGDDSTAWSNYRLWQVSSSGNTYQTGEMSATNVHAYDSSNAKVVAGSWNFDGMLFDSGRPALIARGAYPHLELWANISNSNHGATIRLGGYDNGSSGNYKSWHIGTPGSDLYFMDIAYGGRNNPNPHAGIAGLGDSYSYPGAFNMMRFHNNGNIGVGNFGTYGSGDNTPGYKLDVRGNGRYTQLLYLDAVESLNLYGVRGRFTNEYIHLYNKVGIGHPSGWGQGEGNTPNFGLSTYGGANIGYGNSGGLSVTGLLRIASSDNLYLDTNYGQSIVGVYASTRYQGIFAMGDSYKLAINGTTTGNLYGLAWSHPNAGGVAGNLNTHGLLVMENGTFLAAVSGSIRARDDMRAPYFYGSGSIRLGDMWGGAGLYRPGGSMVFGLEDSDWVFSKSAVTQAYFSGGDGNLWMRWAGDWLSNLLGAKQNASTAINTSNIGSQSVSYAASAGTASNLQGYSASALVTQSRGMHSGSDFPNGTLVRTDISADGFAGNSFVMEVSGKSYGSGTPFKLVMEGYLYADTIINVSAMSYGSYFPGGLMVFRLDGRLCFWWARGSYWNSFEVHVRSADGESWNRVTSIGDSPDPGGDKRVGCTPTQVVHSGNIGSQSVDYANRAGSITSQANSATINASTGINANDIVRRDGNGYIFANHINFNTPESENPAINSFFTSNGDGWSRKSSIQHVRNQLGNYGSWITGYTETDTLATVTGRGASTSSAISINNQLVVTDGRVTVRTGGFNTYGIVSGYDNNNHLMTFRAAVSGPTASPTFTAGHQMTFVEYAQPGDTTGWYFKSSSNTNYEEIARITRDTFNYNGHTVIHSGNIGSQSVNYASSAGSAASVAWGNVSSKPASWLNTTNLIDDNNPDTAVPSGFYQNYGNSPTGTWMNYVNVRHSNPGNVHGFQIGMSYYDNILWFRSYQGGGTYQSWAFAISSQNIASQSVNYANSAGSLSSMNISQFTNNSGYITSSGSISGSAGSATNATQLSTNYIGGVYRDPQAYFNNGIGVKVAMTGHWSVWSDTLWVNGYSGGDVPWMCALHFLRNSEPRFAISAQTHTGSSYGTIYEVITAYNIASQSVAFASNAGNANSISNAVGGAYTWTGINYFRTNQGGYCGSTDSGKMQAYSDSNNSAFFSWHKGGHYATNMGLDADNVIRIGGWSAAANRWQLDMSGNMTVAGDVTAYSDARVKTDVKTIENALLKVLNLRGVSYVRTDSDDKNTKIGVIAQETLQVLPEVVNQDAAGMYNVSYGNMVGLLIEAIKEQQKEINELKAKLN